MKASKSGKLNFHSIIVKFLLIFLVFGGVIVLLTVSIQKDLAQTMTEEMTEAMEEMSLSALEKKLGEGDWAIRDYCLFKGARKIGGGAYENADIEPFIETESETGSFVYSFIRTSFADPELVSSLISDGREKTDYLRVAGSTLDKDGNPIVGTFLDRSITEELNKNDTFSGRSYVEGRLFYCYYRTLRDGAGKIIGAIVAGRSIEELETYAHRSALNSSLTIGVIILYTFAALFLFVVKWNRALKRTEKYLADIGNGTYPKKPLKISGGDELSGMAEVINDMKFSLEERERLRNELELARTIQAEMLPDEATADKLPERARVSGFMTPAREVGGDLYDFFMIDEERLGLVIADVSDKGAPAALFMATAKMCIKDHMMLGAEPYEVLKNVNNRLLENNKSGLFVTAWIGEVNLSDGHMKYAMAGHPEPFIGRADGQTYEMLCSDKNLVLAGWPNFEYRQAETVLLPGDRLFLYTDGLDEARDPEGGFFGKARIKAFLDANFTADLQRTVSGMKTAADDFASGREQFDDLTMLLFEYAGGERNE